MPFDGRVVVVTGAGSGIGRGAAVAFAAAGARVGTVDVDADGLRATAERIDCATAVADVADSAAVSRAFAALVDRLGDIDILVNVAGAATIGAVHELSDNDWAGCLGRNLTGTFHCCRAVLPTMQQRGHGVIVNLASSLGRIAAPRFAAYTAAKAGVAALSMQMARDYGPQIRVNSVSAAAIDTPGLRRAIDASPDPAATEAEIVAGNQIAYRLGTVDEVVAGIVFAASDSSSFMMGHDLVLCGGQTVVAY